MEEQNKVKNIEESQENWLKTIERKMMHIKYTKERRWLRIEERGNIKRNDSSLLTAGWFKRCLDETKIKCRKRFKKKCRKCTTYHGDIAAQLESARYDLRSMWVKMSSGVKRWK